VPDPELLFPELLFVETLWTYSRSLCFMSQQTCVRILVPCIGFTDASLLSFPLHYTHVRSCRSQAIIAEYGTWNSPVLERGGYLQAFGKGTAGGPDLQFLRRSPVRHGPPPLWPPAGRNDQGRDSAVSDDARQAGGTPNAGSAGTAMDCRSRT